MEWQYSVQWLGSREAASVLTRADEPVARVPGCHAAFTAVPVCFICSPNQRLCIAMSVYIYIYVCVCVCVWDCIQSMYELPLLPSNVASETLCTQIGSAAKCWLDIYHWGPGLVVTGRIHDIGQNVLQSSFRGGSSNTPSYFQIFLLIALLQEAFIRNEI